jgi:dGTPase
VTQVASPTELHPVHNRLIHSLKVAQVGRALAERIREDAENADLLEALGGVDADVVEAAALAHDLGHPPFGHVAESALDQMMIESKRYAGAPDGFNGNAQSFRIVTKLAVRYSAQEETDLAGLNLSRVTLNAILKYPWARGTDGRENEKWGAYSSESADFNWARQHATSVRGRQTIEAALMDWADDITYAVHDVEDFFRAGLIPLDRLTSDPREQERFGNWVVESGKFSVQSPDEVVRLLRLSIATTPGVLAPFRGTRSDRASLRTLTSKLINRYVSRSVSLRQLDDHVELQIDDELQKQVEVLMALTRFYVIDSPSLVSQRYGQRALITSLFSTFEQAASARKDRTIFPPYYQEALEYANTDERQIKRVISDLIASLSESQVIATHQRLTGQSLGSAMDAYLQ